MFIVLIISVWQIWGGTGRSKYFFHSIVSDNFYQCTVTFLGFIQKRIRFGKSCNIISDIIIIIIIIEGINLSYHTQCWIFSWTRNINNIRAMLTLKKIQTHSMNIKTPPNHTRLSISLYPEYTHTLAAWPCCTDTMSHFSK